MQTRAPLHVGQIGCGYWGPNLLRNLQASPKCSLSAVADTSAERRSFVGNRFPGAKLYSNWHDLIDDSSLQAVVVATPAATHFTIVEAALQAGRHVLVEKPMATGADEVVELIRLADRLDLVLMVGHTFIYNDAVRRLKAMLDEGELGDVVYLYSQRLNLGQVRSDVNAWWNLAPHDVSIQLFLLGDTSRQAISATGRAFLQPGIEDVVVANLTWRNGVVGAIHVSWLDPHKTRQLTVVGTRKMIVYDDVSEHKLTVYEKGFDPIPRLGEHMDFDAKSPLDFRPRQGAVIMPHCPVREPLGVEIDHFLECIHNERVPETDGRHALAVVSVLEAAQASLKLGGTPMQLKETIR